MLFFFGIVWAWVIPAVVTTRWQPRWKAIVINLGRRPDRLQRFVKEMNLSAAWLLNQGQVCRTAGRDGLKLLEAGAPHLPPTGPASKAFLGSGTLQSTRADALHNPIPQDPLQEEHLLKGGWLSMEASTILHSNSAVWPKMTAGGVGVYLSHASAWRHVLDKGLEFGVIFEDDVVLYSPSFTAELYRILGGHQTWDWDFIYLQLDVKSWPKSNPCPFKSVQSSQELVTSGLIPNTGAYIVTRRGAAKLLQGAFPARMQLDAQLGQVPTLKRAQLDPIVVQCSELTKVADRWYRDTDTQHGYHSNQIKQLQDEIKDFSVAGPGASSFRREIIPECA